jgi:hypothetical protein
MMYFTYSSLLMVLNLPLGAERVMAVYDGRTGVAQQYRAGESKIKEGAVVTVTLGLPNVTVPGPLTLLQLVVTVLPAGRPSSLTPP